MTEQRDANAGSGRNAHERWTPAELRQALRDWLDEEVSVDEYSTLEARVGYWIERWERATGLVFPPRSVAGVGRWARVFEWVEAGCPDAYPSDRQVAPPVDKTRLAFEFAELVRKLESPEWQRAQALKEAAEAKSARQAYEYACAEWGRRHEQYLESVVRPRQKQERKEREAHARKREALANVLLDLGYRGHRLQVEFTDRWRQMHPGGYIYQPTPQSPIWAVAEWERIYLARLPSFQHTRWLDGARAPDLTHPHQLRSRGFSKVYEEMAPLLRSQVGKASATWPWVEYDDAWQVAAWALWDAFQRFQGRSKFITYAVPSIRNRLCDYADRKPPRLLSSPQEDETLSTGWVDPAAFLILIEALLKTPNARDLIEHLLGISKPGDHAAEQRRSRARVRLREALANGEWP